MLSVVLITRDDYCSARLRFGNGRPSYVERLFQREKGRVSDHRVHERVLVNVVERLEGELHRYTIKSLSHRVLKGDAHATTAAEELHRQGEHAGVMKLLFIFPLSVFRDLILKAGILDGVGA